MSSIVRKCGLRFRPTAFEIILNGDSNPPKCDFKASAGEK
jgi:hypothetical protein